MKLGNWESYANENNNSTLVKINFRCPPGLQRRGKSQSMPKGSCL